jgi:hypothetical protein
VVHAFIVLQEMKRFFLIALGILGAMVLVLVVTNVVTSGMSFDWSREPRSGQNEQSQQSSESLHRQFEGAQATRVREDPPWKTKFQERLGAEEQAKKRLERRRDAIIKTIEECENAGMGEGHPFVVSATDDLWRILAEQDGTGQPATRPESKSEGGDKPQPDEEGLSR